MDVRTTSIFLLLLLGVAGGAQAQSTVESLDPHTDAIAYVREKGWMSQHADNTFRPDRALTKAELTKIIVLAAGLGDEAERCELRRSGRTADVPPDAWYARYLCIGLREKWWNYPSDGKMHPGKKVTLAETSKLLSLAIEGREPAFGEPWFKPYVSALAAKNAVPPTIASYKSYVTRGEMAEMLWRLKEQKTQLAAADSGTLLHGKCTWFEESGVPGVDMDEVRRTWLGWYNGVRSEMGLQPLRYNKLLHRTAYLWSQRAANAGTITHKRDGQTAYYDYAKMVHWFDGLQVTFANVDRMTFTENIGWGVYKCPATGDCTKTFIDAIRSTFDMYMAEKGKAYDAHYQSIVNPKFKELGVGIVTKGNKYYLTAHYGTSITSQPQPLCP